MKGKAIILAGLAIRPYSIVGLTALITLHIVETVSQTITEASQVAGFQDLRECQQCVLQCDPNNKYYQYITNGIRNMMRCNSWICVCDNLQVAIVKVSSFANSMCSDTLAGASPVKLLRTFCLEYTTGAPISNMTIVS